MAVHKTGQARVSLVCHLDSVFSVNAIIKWNIIKMLYVFLEVKPLP